MAGGWFHVTDDEGRLQSGRVVVDMLDTGGDVVECVTQLYGMVQFLANELAVRGAAGIGSRESWVSVALDHDQDGVLIGGVAPS